MFFSQPSRDKKKISIAVFFFFCSKGIKVSSSGFIEIESKYTLEIYAHRFIIKTRALPLFIFDKIGKLIKNNDWFDRWSNYGVSSSEKREKRLGISEDAIKFISVTLPLWQFSRVFSRTSFQAPQKSAVGVVNTLPEFNFTFIFCGAGAASRTCIRSKKISIVDFVWLSIFRMVLTEGMELDEINGFVWLRLWLNCRVGKMVKVRGHRICAFKITSLKIWILVQSLVEPNCGL